MEAAGDHEASRGLQSSAPGSPDTPRIRVLGWPAFKTRESNPYPWLLYTHLAQEGCDVEEYTPWRALYGRFDILHIHWPDYQLAAPGSLTALVRVLYFVTIVRWSRWRGARLVWTVHNVASHEREHPRLEGFLWKVVVSAVDGCLCLTEDGRDLVLRRFPGLRGRRMWVTRHGHYRGAYPDDVSSKAARQWLGVESDTTVLTFFGDIRPYKNVASLIECFSMVARRDAILVIAGRPHTASLRRKIMALAAPDPRVRLALNHVPTQQVQYFLRAANLTVLPFGDTLNSGSALLALSFDCPVLVPLVGAIGDLRDSVGPDWVWTYERELTPRVLETALERASRREPGSADLAAHDWSSIASQTARAFRELVGQTVEPVSDESRPAMESRGL